MTDKLIIITGPTACGKTKVSVDIAKEIGGEIISADSMQIYKYMDIGTAKITPKEMQGIRHYLIDALYPDEEYSVAVFVEMAKGYIEEIRSRGKIPIICGGTGFYINALINGNSFTQMDKSDEIRAELYAAAEKFGNEYLHDMLKELDPVSAENIHMNNIKRVVRAIEYYRQSGERISEHNIREKMKTQSENAKVYFMHMDRTIMYERINCRVDKMIADGLIDEVYKLLELGYNKNLVSMQGIGYKELMGYVDGRATQEEAVYDIKINTRHFAKRQLTWFTRQTQGMWVDALKTDSKEIILKDILGDLSARISG